VTRRRERFETPDGDFLDLDWFTVAEAPGRSGLGAPAPLVLILHGLEGSTLSTYMHVLARELAARGIECAGLNFRSCGGEMNRKPRMYHAGEWGDAVFVLERLAARFPGRALCVAGFSLGGNALLRWLGEAGGQASALVRAAAVVSVPYDLAAGSRFIASGVRRVYLRRLLSTLKAKIVAKRELLPDLSMRIDVARALAAKDFFEFDDAVVAPLHGFRGVDDYYARASSGPWLHGIRVPTLLVHAEDDPFLPASSIPRAAIAANAQLTAAISRHGGHVGFVHGTPWAPRFFAEERVAEFFAAALRSPT